MSTQCKVESRPGCSTVIHISGRISENTRFPAVESLASADTLQIDLSGVEQINSCGVREWIRFVTRASRSAVTLELVRCPPAIVRQLNMISNFSGGGSVKSVMLPYYCADCGHEERQLLELSRKDPAPHIEEVIACPGC